MISVKEFTARRAKLVEKMVDNSIAIIYAGVAKKSSYDQTYPFVVNRNFYYLTNIQQEGSILVLTKANNVVNEYLFVSEYSELKEKWTGVRLTAEQAENLSGIKSVLYLNTFDSQLSMFLDQKKKPFGLFNTVYLDMEEENKLAPKTTTLEIKERLSANYQNLKFEDIYKEICRLRSVKSAQEVEEFRAAINKTNIGINKILQNMKPGMKEYQLSSLFYYTIQDFDNSELAFSTICASGKNAVILHYPTPVDTLKDGDLILLDLGSQNNSYCADISRTFPINGKFTELQRKIYQIVLDCNKMIAKTAKPGLTLLKLQEFAKDFLARRCLEAGLIKTLEEINNVYYHSVSHFIGIDVHDPWDRSETLVSGNVISDEPGLYFKEYGIGIRIEDDLLITDDGCYVLSNNIIKEIEDIERAMMYKG